MAVSSMILQRGEAMPEFELPTVFNQGMIGLDHFENAKAALVMFLCRHCPYAVHVQHAVSDVVKEYEPAGLIAVGICSTDVDQYPADGAEGLRAQAMEAGFTFPYLVDEDQSVAKAFRAVCTPDFFLFDGKRRLTYRGQFDDSRPKSEEPVTGADLRAAIEATITGQALPDNQKPSQGCGIAWRPGNEPDYLVQ